MLSAGYRGAVAARNRLYDRGWIAVHRAGVPVISVGNITLGGTGKTPMVEWICRRLRSWDYRVVILSRGYGATEGLSDEGRVLDANLPDVPHLQGPDRVQLAGIALEELEAEVLVLDDGFQHRRLGRDLDIVLIDALDPFGLGRLTPRGLLREPLGSLRRAGVVVLSRADMIDAPTRAAVRARVARHAGPVSWAEARHAPRDLIQADGSSADLARLAASRIAVFCGIGNPEGFRRTLQALNVEPVGFRTFPDHHAYRAQDVSDIASWAAGLKADFALTTQKDLVKLRANTLGALPLFALRIGLEFTEGEAIIEAALRSRVPDKDGLKDESS